MERRTRAADLVVIAATVLWAGCVCSEELGDIVTSASDDSSDKMSTGELMLNVTCETFVSISSPPQLVQSVLGSFKSQIEAGADPDLDVSCLKFFSKCLDMFSERNRIKLSCPPLYWASWSGQQEFINYLLDKGANVNATCDTYDSPLLVARLEVLKDLEVIQTLVDNGARVRSVDHNGETMLHRIIAYVKNFTTTSPLSNYGLKLTKKNLNYLSNNTLSVVKKLVQQGLDINVKSNDGLTPLLLITRTKHLYRQELLFLKQFYGVNDFHLLALRINKRFSEVEALLNTLDVTLVNILLENGANVETRDLEGKTPLHWAVANCMADMIQSLLSWGANINAKQFDNKTVLHLALDCRKGVVQLLLDGGADVNATDAEGTTPLLLAVREGIVWYAEYLISHGADVNRRNDCHDEMISLPEAEYITDRFSTSLDIVLQSCNSMQHWRNSSSAPSSVLRALLSRGVNVNSTLCYGASAIHVAFPCSDQIKDMIMQSGADMNAKLERPDFSATALQIAVGLNDLSYARLLLRNGADVNGVESVHGWTALHFSVVHRFIPFDLPPETSQVCKATRLLIENGADVNARQKDGWTPMHLAVVYDKLGNLKYLSKHGAYLNPQLNDGWTPLHLAVHHDKEVCVSFLLEEGADVNPVLSDGWTPLHIAVRDGHWQVSKILIEHGANVNAVMKDSWTPWMIAVVMDQTELVKLLVDNGAEVSAWFRFVSWWRFLTAPAVPDQDSQPLGPSFRILTPHSPSHWVNRCESLGNWFEQPKNFTGILNKFLDAFRTPGRCRYFDTTLFRHTQESAS